MESSPWFRQRSPSTTLAGPRTQTVSPTPGQALPSPQNAPQWPTPPQPVVPTRSQRPIPFGKISAALATVAVAAAVGSGTTLLWVAHETHSSPTTSAAMTTQSTPAETQFSPKEVSAAKDNLCQVFNMSVRGQQGQGGFRVEGNLNIPLTLRTLNSVTAVQDAVVPATPPDVADAARKYVTTTLAVTTAAMGNAPTSEVNALNTSSNDALYELIDVCGLPR